MVHSIGRHFLALGISVTSALAIGVSAWGANDRLPLETPIDCQVGDDCFVQNYVDAQAGPGHRDYTCGPLSYNEHDGTDIRLRDLVAMERGVWVLAAAPGVVRAVRDGMEDVSVKEIGREAVREREAGNAVAIRHRDGWETQYSHLRKDSVRVSRGQRVETGDRLGLVGLSGGTEFPHLEFAVRYRGKHLDPYTGLAPEQGCGRTATPLWSKAAVKELLYVPTAVLNSGFTDSVPTAREVRSGRHRRTALSADASVLVFWTDVFGLRKNDVVEMRLVGPDGRTLAGRKKVLEKDKAQQFTYIGKKLKTDQWSTGIYRGEYVVFRGQNGNEKQVVRIDRRVQLSEN